MKFPNQVKMYLQKSILIIIITVLRIMPCSTIKQEHLHLQHCPDSHFSCVSIAKRENLWSGFCLAWIPCGSFTINPLHINTTTHRFASLTSTLNMNVCVPVLNDRQPTAVSICAAPHEITYKCIVNGVVPKGRFIPSTFGSRVRVYIDSKPTVV